MTRSLPRQLLQAAAGTAIVLAPPDGIARATAISDRQVLSDDDGGAGPQFGPVRGRVGADCHA